jgi:pimeloyl-ACP methyl ester carboxylesterase
VPLRRAEPGARTIRLFAKWIPAKTPRHRALWLVPGGPGYAGSRIEGFALRLHDADPGLDVYIPDHRGAGRSTWLGCATEESDMSPGGGEITKQEWPACFASLKATWGDGLAAFNTTEAANDLGSLIERTRAPNDSVFVYGVSYGTYLVQRYLQLYPKQPTGVVLDSIAPPVAAFSQSDRWSDDVARKLLDACDQDRFCQQKLGGHAWDRSQRALLGLEKSGCPELGPKARPVLRAKLAGLLNAPERRALIAAIGYRVARCTPGDVSAVQHFLTWQPPPPASFGSPIVQQHYSEVLSTNIALSELWEDPAPPASEVRARRDTAVVAPGFLPDYADLYSSWPRYARDTFVGKWARSDVPMLMLAGTLDPATPVEMSRTVGANFHGQHQTFVEFSNAPHGVFDNTAVRTAGALPCGTQVILSFLGNPGVAPDTTCMADMKPLDFRGSPELAQAALGTADLWEN